MKKITHQVDFCVIGGGIAGLCAAIAAARNGVRVAIMQDRPVFGGNASSEIRMWICGAHGLDNRETGIVEELMLENFHRNTGLKYPLWDSILYEKAALESNLKMFLNCSCMDAKTRNNRIESVTGWQLTSETYHTIEAKYFADCSGDSILASLTDAQFMYGREAKLKFNETIAPDTADRKTMGMSCLFQIRETNGKKVFIPPKWAYKYPTDELLRHREHNPYSNFWWIEIGGEADCIHDTEELKHELLKIAFGVWDHMKNYGDHGVDNWEMEWIGFLPGKRESRRYIGKHIITQNDVEAEGRFDDVVAYAGWSMDDHFPQGFYYNGGCSTIFHPAPSPWGIPLRSLYSNNIKNLFFAGRNISVTHAAMSSSRVMATCGIIGQAVGTAASIVIKDNTSIDQINISNLQQKLMFDDCYIPWKIREISAITKLAKSNTEIARNGIDRGDENCWVGDEGEYIEYDFAKPQKIKQIRIVFDSNLNRNYQNMPCYYPLKEEKFKLPQTLVRDYKIIAVLESDEEYIINVADNCQRFVLHNVNLNIKSIKLIPIKTWGCEQLRIFSFEII